MQVNLMACSLWILRLDICQHSQTLSKLFEVTVELLAINSATLYKCYCLHPLLQLQRGKQDLAIQPHQHSTHARQEQWQEIRMNGTNAADKDHFQRGRPFNHWTEAMHLPTRQPGTKTSPWHFYIYTHVLGPRLSFVLFSHTVLHCMYYMYEANLCTEQRVVIEASSLLQSFKYSIYFSYELP